jgi:osmotically-inducible protein OsmY
MKDRILRQSIIAALDFEPSIDADNIGVIVDDGVVTLSGHVSSYAQKLAAETVVKRIKGVAGIAQEIEVRLDGDQIPHDDEIAKQALVTLAYDVLLPADAIQVRVAKGWVTLTGEVD